MRNKMETMIERRQRSLMEEKEKYLKINDKAFVDEFHNMT